MLENWILSEFFDIFLNYLSTSSIFCKTSCKHDVFFSKIIVHNIIFISKINLCVAYWLATCVRKPMVHASSTAAPYVQRWAVCSNRSANVSVPVRQMKVVDRNQRNALLLPLQPCDLWMVMKKKEKILQKYHKVSHEFSFLTLLITNKIPDNRPNQISFTMILWPTTTLTLINMELCIQSIWTIENCFRIWVQWCSRRYQ